MQTLRSWRTELGQAILDAENNLKVDPEGDIAELSSRREMAEIISRLAEAETHELE